MLKIKSSNHKGKLGLEDKVSELKSQLNKSYDFIFKEHEIENQSLGIVYFESLINTQYLDQYILPRIGVYRDGSVMEKLKSLFQAEDVTEKSVDDLSNLLFEGSVFFYLKKTLLSIQAGEFPKRKPEESAIETSLRGPKDGFVEDIKTNISLIRRRLNTSSLCTEKYVFGKRSKTKVALLYMDDIIDQRVLDEVHRRMETIDVDILTSIHDLESYIGDRPYSIFPSMDYSGRPDLVVQALNQGRFAIIVDGNPTVSYAPVNLLLQTKSPEDSYLGYAYVSIERLIRMLGLIISAFLPGIWISFSAFNIEQIPYLLVATISVSRFGLPLSAPMEMIIVLFLFELFSEAGVRLPRAIGQTVAVLGGLIVGDAAIRAGLTSPTMLVVAAITYISSFTLVNQYLSTAITILRFITIALSTVFGLFGVIIGFILTIFYFSTISSYGEPYLGSLTPITSKEVLRSLLQLPRQFYKTRTSTTSPKDPTRGGNQS